VVALTGARCRDAGRRAAALLAGAPVKAGSVLKLGAASGPARAPTWRCGRLRRAGYLGSRATFTLGQFGGHAGRTLRTGDVLHLATDSAGNRRAAASTALAPPLLHPLTHGLGHRRALRPARRARLLHRCDIDTFFATDWEVHYNSSRTGVRLIGPKPQWARTTAARPACIPSNIHDNAYAIGAIDFTGDMPVILGPDGPSLGGFVCPATIVQAELWKLGSCGRATRCASCR
jgi:urea carboxylase